MNAVFPGMDPYLENPVIWQGFHNRFVVHIADLLQPLIEPRYITSVEERVFVEGSEHREIIPDVWIREDPTAVKGPPTAVLESPRRVYVTVPSLEVRENYIEILDRNSELKVVTLIEVVSPTNKVFGEGRDSYRKKQKEVRASPTHLVEIDLLRMGRHVLLVPEWSARAKGAYDYLISVNRARDLREEFELYLCLLRQRLPEIHIPLAEGDADVMLDLQTTFTHTYRLGSYRRRLSYDRPCEPPLSPEDQAWADELLRAAKTSDGNP